MPLLFLVCLLGLLGLLAARPLHAFRTNAGGICDTLPASIARMSTTRHGDNGNAGGEFTLSASSANGQAVQVTLSGVSFRGLVLAALDENGNHIGRFEGYPSYFEAQTRCEGPEGSVLQHNNAEEKPAPQTFTWTSGVSTLAKNATINFQALIVVTTPQWFLATPTKIQYGAIVTPTAPPSKPTVTPSPIPDPPARSFVDFTKSPWFFLTIWGTLLVLSALAVATKAEEGKLETQGVKQAAQVLWTKQEQAKRG